MSELDRLAAWIDRYVRAWNTNSPADIGGLFADDAEYYTEPYGPPWRGQERIVREWLARQDEPGETTFEWQPVAVTDEVAVVRGTTTYPDRTYSNLWVIRLNPDGRCREFTEWWMQKP
jgi:SnoaL-like domain